MIWSKILSLSLVLMATGTFGQTDSPNNDVTAPLVAAGPAPNAEGSPGVQATVKVRYVVPSTGN